MDQTYGIDNSDDSRNILQPAQNPFNANSRPLAAQTQLPAGPNAAMPLASNPLFGRPYWSYTGVQPGPVRGPLPRLSVGSGQTAMKSGTGTSPAPGYLTESDYFPTQFSYLPRYSPQFLKRIPGTMPGIGTNGRVLVGTYEPHDVDVADRFLNHMRSAANWQVQEFPPDYRNLLVWQQVERYRVQSYTLAARPLPTSAYFLGYQVNSQLMGQIGQNNLGSLGSGG